MNIKLGKQDLDGLSKCKGKTAYWTKDTVDGAVRQEVKRETIMDVMKDL